MATMYWHCSSPNEDRAQEMGLVMGRMGQMMGIDRRYVLSNSKCVCVRGIHFSEFWWEDGGKIEDTREETF